MTKQQETLAQAIARLNNKLFSRSDGNIYFAWNEEERVLAGEIIRHQQALLERTREAMLEYKEASQEMADSGLPGAYARYRNAEEQYNKTLAALSPDQPIRDTFT